MRGGGWWRRRRRSAGGAGGGGVNEAAALRWRRWRRLRERGVGVGGDGDHYGGDGGGGEGGGGEDRLAEKQHAEQNARHEEEDKWPVTAQQQRQAAAPTPWAHPRKLRKSNDEDVSRVSLGHPREIRPVGRISDSRRFAISQFRNFLWYYFIL
jgi:hypothetical protein